MIAITDLPRTAGEWLERNGWKRHTDMKARWELQSSNGNASVTLRPVSSSWQAWYLHGGSVPQTSTVKMLRANRSVPGPFKFVRGSHGRPLCRADLPIELLEGQGESNGSLDSFQHPVETWAKSLTALARGAEMGAIETLPSSAMIAAALEKKGWATASDGGALRIHMPLPGLFRQVSIETSAAAGTRLSCELVDLAGWPMVSRRAALSLVHQANERLHLVRFAMTAAEEHCRVLAEVNLANARVPGAWLDMALHAMQTAIHLTARELAALRDPELAAWTLAAAAAGGRKEVSFVCRNAR